jgi:hypothetical protein
MVIASPSDDICRHLARWKGVIVLVHMSAAIPEVLELDECEAGRQPPAR